MKSCTLRAFVASALLFGSLHQVANALSCIAPTPQGQFANFEQSSDEYHIFEGRITALQSIPKLKDKQGLGVPAKIKARFEGYGFGPNGLTTRASSFDLAVTIECVSHWCGGFPSEETQLYFFKYDGAYSLKMGVCGGTTLEASSQNRQALMSCFGGGCINPYNAPPEPRPEPEDSCGKDYLGDLIGQPSTDLPAFLRNNRNVRVIAPDSIVTMDHILSRLNIYTSVRGRIESLKCG